MTESLFDLDQPRRRTDAELAEEFKAILAELRMSAVDLADYMSSNGDHREYSAILRAIQRAISEETRVSGELFVIANMLVRRHRRLKHRYSDKEWQINDNGTWWTQIEDWYVYAIPQTKGRWILTCRHGLRPQEYSPPFGRWLSSLEEAKAKALSCVEEGMNNEASIFYRRE